MSQQIFVLDRGPKDDENERKWFTPLAEIDQLLQNGWTVVHPPSLARVATNYVTRTTIVVVLQSPEDST